MICEIEHYNTRVLKTKFLTHVLAIFGALVSFASADLHTYCACQGGTGLPIHVYATQRVHDQNQEVLKWGQDAPGIWLGHASGLGPRFGGSFVERKVGRIDGKWMYNQGRLYGGLDSTCFECSRVQMNGKDKICTQS
ncbi:hypothetical protein CPAR01_02226 [Colletotrichum paranaense]|uniref:Uncharacterized protein n=1 Tax=Colletotrichum paranaense TaxID=1914294 RepID=A0ABQ9SZ08_9PEZI|nr:uncharacterized protein CPAR01_02226 [Colletotrichum paranaense]KAK1544724.1 hypothetical protein CPAR01_02226 [Colletotrichum paranaense]